MKNFTFTLFITMVALSTCLGFPSQQSAPLIDHMTEVNKEWTHQAPNHSDLQKTVSFANDILRIQAHLYWVEKTLRERTPDHLAPQQRTNRLAMLDLLKTYTANGIFPINTGHSLRIPYFIDHIGTPCAVGHLVIESGFEDFALKIHKEMNQVYIREIPYPELGEWATAHGFTVDELAWIQPGYSPSTNSRPLATGVDGAVTAMVTDTVSETLYIAGSFSDAGGVACNQVTAWNGTAFSSLGNGLNGDIHTAIMFNGDLYIGGTFPDSTFPSPNLAKWNGTQWEMSALHDGTIYDLHIHKGELYAGGDFGSTGGLHLENIAKWNSFGWEPVGGSLDGPVHSLATHNGELYAGGEFTTSGPTPIQYIARLNEQTTYWEAVADTTGKEFDNYARALYSHNGYLYAGSNFFDAQGDTTMGVAKFDGQHWTWVLEPDPNNWLNLYGNDTVMTYVSSFIEYKNSFIMSGHFNASIGLTHGNEIAEINEFPGTYTAFNPLFYFWPSKSVNAQEIYKGELILGGDFNFHSDMDYLLATTVDQSAGAIEPVLPGVEVTFGPNPVTTTAWIQFKTEVNYGTPSLRVFDISGKFIPVRHQVANNKITLHRDNLSRGLYLYEIVSEEGIWGRGKMVIAD